MILPNAALVPFLRSVENTLFIYQQDGSCQFNPAKVVTTVTGCVNVVPPTETSLKLHVAMGGPVSVAIDASLGSFQFYKGGKSMLFKTKLYIPNELRWPNG